MLFSRIFTFASLAIVGGCGVAAMANPVTVTEKRQTDPVAGILDGSAAVIATETAFILSLPLPILNLTSLVDTLIIEEMQSEITAIEALGLLNISDVSGLTGPLESLVETIIELVTSAAFSTSPALVSSVDAVVASIINSVAADAPSLPSELATALTSAGITKATLESDGLPLTAVAIFGPP